MKHLKLNYLLIALALITTLASCHKDKVNGNIDTPTAQRAGIYILNQGNFGSSNSSLTYYDYTSKILTPDIYSSVNKVALGATANDAKIYGSKLYLVVDKSGSVNVVNAKTSKLIDSVKFVLADKTSREPRSIAFYKSNAFITLYDGNVAVMDTTTLKVSKYIPVGQNPEQLVVSNGKLYVANSGGLNYLTPPDKTVSVIDLSTLAVIKTITVGDDPYAISADSYGDVFVHSYGIYGSATSVPALTIINSTTDVVKKATTAFSGGPFSINGDNAYYIAANGQILVYNVVTGISTSSNFITDGTAITTPYAVAVDSLTGEVFVTDAKNYASNGTLYAFDKNGKKEYSLTVGINSGTITFVNK